MPTQYHNIRLITIKVETIFVMAAGDSYFIGEERLALLREGLASTVVLRPGSR
jgi:hypothetical protein